MKKIIIIIFLVLIYKTYGYSESPQSALFLNAPVGARASALGGAYTALASGVEGLYWNPASVSSERTTELTFFRNEYFADINQHYLGYSQYFKKIKSSFGVSLNLFDYGKFDRTILTSATTYSKQGTFRAKDFVFGLSWSPDMDKKLKFGITMNFIKSRIADENAEAASLDIGWIAKAGSDELPLYIGAVVKNLGSKLKYNKERENLPLTQKIGAAVEIEYLNIFVIRPAIDFAFNFIDKKKDIMCGVEIEYDKKILVEAGYNTINDAGSGLSFGCGINLKKFQIHYAYIPNSDLDNSHKFSAVYRFK